MLQINGKTFMNLQEAVQWLLNNNALPFQCNVAYVANTEIAKTAIINPSPAEIKVGALVLFSDSKIGTVSGLTSNGFMVGPEYTDIKNALAYIVSVNVDSSGNLTCTLSDGETMSAGQIKQVSNFSIDASQHLIANYNNGTSTDLGAIFSGNVNIAGNFTADSIIENMTGYSFDPSSVDSRVTLDYVGAVKTGNKITFVIAGQMVLPANISTGSYIDLGLFLIPSAVCSHIIANFSPNRVGPTPVLIAKDIQHGYMHSGFISKYTDGRLKFMFNPLSEITADTYYFRYEVTFLLGTNLVA